MRLRCFCSIAAAAAPAVTALTPGPDIALAVAAPKPRPDAAAAGKAKPPTARRVGAIDTQARSALVMEVETGAVFSTRVPKSVFRRVDVEADDRLSRLRLSEGRPRDA